MIAERMRNTSQSNVECLLFGNVTQNHQQKKFIVFVVWIFYRGSESAEVQFTRFLETGKTQAVDSDLTIYSVKKIAREPVSRERY